MFKILIKYEEFSDSVYLQVMPDRLNLPFHFEEEYYLFDDVINGLYQSAINKLNLIKQKSKYKLTLSQVYHNLATLYFLKCEYNTMFKYANAAIQFGNKKSVYLLGCYYSSIKCYSKMIDHFNSILDEPSLNAAYKLMKYYASCQFFNKKLKSLTKYILITKQPISLAYLGLYYQNQGNKKKALKYLTYAVDIGGSYYASELGYYYEREGDYKNMIINYEIAISVNNTNAMIMLSEYFISKKEYDQAVIYLEKAVNFGCYNVLGLLEKCYGKLDRFLDISKTVTRYLDTIICDCKFRNICNFKCKNTHPNMVLAFNQFNDNLKDKKCTLDANYLEILRAGQKYLNSNNLKILNEYLSLKYLDEDERGFETECVICFDETNKGIQLYCCHQVCYLCYPNIKKCPICSYSL